jgi:hypothetical protein
MLIVNHHFTTPYTGLTTLAKLGRFVFSLRGEGMTEILPTAS